MIFMYKTFLFICNLIFGYSSNFEFFFLCLVLKDAVTVELKSSSCILRLDLHVMILIKMLTLPIPSTKIPLMLSIVY